MAKPDSSKNTSRSADKNEGMRADKAPAALKQIYRTDGFLAEGRYRNTLENIHVIDGIGREYDITPARIPSSIAEYKDLFTSSVTVRRGDGTVYKVMALVPHSDNYTVAIDKNNYIPLVNPTDRVYDKYGNVLSIEYVLCADDSWRAVPVLISVTADFLVTYGAEMLADFKAGLTAVHEQNGALAKSNRELAKKLAGEDRKARQEVAHAEATAHDHKLLAEFHRARADLHERRGDLFEAILKQYADIGSWTVTDDGKSVLHTKDPGYELAVAALNNPLAVAARG